MTSSPTVQPETIILSPSYQLPIGVAALAFAVGWLSVWVGVPIFLFAVFLGVQAAMLRLHFTTTALEIYRGKTQIRFFPYAGWYHWEIYWPAVPILFYFREVNSIHFLPMLFDPAALTQSLNAFCPRKQDLATPSDS
jgi:Protein of unknown function (DUF3119)